MSVVLSPVLKYITEERLLEWKNPNPSGPSRVADPVPMTRFLYELCWVMVCGELPFQKCKTALDSVQFKEEPFGDEMGSILADIIAQFAQDLTISGDYRARLVKTTKALVEASLVPARLLQERCEEEFIFEAELSRMKAQDLKSKEVRVNTRLLYQQTKFNLLREESEGYAKLVTLLCQGCLDSTSNNSLVVISIIKSLIGHFDLDPNRVFDIVLDCFELYPDKKIFYDLIPIFPKSHAAQILGFKFQYYQRMEVSTPVPSALFHLAALLVKENFIDLDSIYPHLLPEDDDAFTHYEGFLLKRIDEANKIGRINLAATGKDLMETEEKQDVSVDFYAVWDMESDVLAERAPEVLTNQKLGLLIGFLSVHDWYHAHILFERLSPMNPVEHVEICKGLFRVIEKTISSAYAIVSKNYQEAPGNSDPAMEIDIPAASSLSVDLLQDFFQMLSVAGPYFHRDTALLQKVCRVLRGYYVSMRDNAIKANSPESNESRKYKEARIRVEDAVGSCLLPSLQLIPANPAIGYEIWDVLSILPYEVRYRLYGEWEKDDERNPLVLSARQLAKLDTRRMLKRLAKENLKQLGRMVAKLAHASPMTVLRTIVQQIEAYRDMIMPVVDAFKYLTQLEYDILEYVVIERLAQGARDKLKEDGLNLSDWLQSLASFWGSLCKKYPSMELRGLFQYLVNQLKKGSGTELVLLEELIEQMANVHYTENITEEQLDALAGSETLRYQSTIYDSTRNNKVLSKSTNRLRDSLLPKDEPKLAIPLLMLIAQYRSMVIIKADAPYIKMVSEQFDRCHGTLLQYVEFLCCAVSPVTAYVQFVPSLHDLAHKYHLEPEVAFLIYRPVMRLFKSPGGEGVCWPLDDSEEANSDAEKGSLDFTLHLDSSQEYLRWSELLNTVESMLPSKSWKSLSPDLYATFWGLTLYDLYIPKRRYETEIAKQHAALKALEELSDTSSVSISKRKKDKEKIQELLDRLVSEYRKHEKHVGSVRQRMGREKDRWLTQCPETVKINMEFLQRCVFPRCIFSATDAAYCAAFVRMLHSLGTPYFNTLHHIDLLICKLLQPMICCCTELEAGRFGRFLCETLRMAYDWKKDESIYERECANMPGFALYYRYPNSQRVSYAQFVRVHFKWSGRITKVLVQCLESTEYMEIRNALIVLTKISAVFPVMRKSGINIEKRVAKIKSDEREDLKVLATGVAATLASHKNSWVSDEEFGMGYIESKPAASPAKAPPAVDSGNNLSKEHTTRHKSTTDARNERSNGAVSRHPDEHAKAQSEEAASKASRLPAESETRAQQKPRGTPSILGKPPKLEDVKSGKMSESGFDPILITATNGGKSSQRGTGASSTTTHVPKVESGTGPRTSHEHSQKRAVHNDEQDRLTKRRKGEERERETDNEKERERDREKERETDRSSRDRADDRHDKEQREREKQRERERERERSLERRERDRSLEKGGREEREREKLPPPPPLPTSFVPQSVSRHSVEREREREREREDDVSKRRKEEDNRDGRKRDDRDSSMSKVEEKEREKLKEDSEANAKRRKVKRSSSTEPGEYSPVVPSSHSYDTRERKAAGTPHRGGYGDDNTRTHSKDTSSKANRRDTEQSQERDWEEEKRQRADTKRKHRK